ncbi:hypothetical protein [Pseudoalteromonas sp. S16_S37]|uniref:hypothetical protein n=1 Tax=Pseudoalteromonas sp. S16_S37 TaxID=2720228 RepID=UPI001680619D|nr:hypothetical protein [Pseudoalteromonas sp. S16_S37]MBD1581380.1 hypothetical protein [Pseudoalteromonas sp. S16_S37]
MNNKHHLQDLLEANLKRVTGAGPIDNLSKLAGQDATEVSSNPSGPAQIGAAATLQGNSVGVGSQTGTGSDHDIGHKVQQNP